MTKNNILQGGCQGGVKKYKNKIPGLWWSATEDGGSESGIAYALNMGHSNGRTAKGNGYKSYGYSVRCVQS